MSHSEAQPEVVTYSETEGIPKEAGGREVLVPGYEWRGADGGGDQGWQSNLGYIQRSLKQIRKVWKPSCEHSQGCSESYSHHICLVRVSFAAYAAEGRVCQKLFSRVLNLRIPFHRWILSINP